MVNICKRKRNWKEKKQFHILILGSRLVYDELTVKYLPRYGSKSVKKNAENAEYIMEVK